MRQLTKAEIDEFNRKMSQWQTPSEVSRLMKDVNGIAETYVAAQGGLKSWREAFIAMSCAITSHAHRVKLGADPPDFELDYGDHQRAFELVDIMPQGWPLRGEHKTFAEKINAGEPAYIRTLTHKQSEAEAESVVDDFTAQLSAKMGKSYPDDTILVADIYHNVYLESDTGVVKNLVRAAQPGLKAFKEIWIRKTRHIIRVSSHSASMLAPPWPIID